MSTSPSPSRDLPRDLPRERRRELSRQRILDEAEAVFAGNGFHDASLREIAARAGFSVGALYTFFANKDDLYAECIHRRGTAFMTAMHDVLAGDDEPLQQLHDLADMQVEFFRRHPHFARLVLRRGMVTPVTEPRQDDAVIQGNIRTSLASQAELFERGQATGELRPGPPMLLARMFSGLVAAAQADDLDTPDADRDVTSRSLHELLDAAFAAAVVPQT